MSTFRFLASLTIISALALAGCEPQGNVAHVVARATSGEVAARVAVVTPTRKTLVRRTEQPGQVQAFQETPIYANVTGFISQVKVDIGDKVAGPKWDDKGRQTQPGQVLAKIAIPELDQELVQKQALVAQAASQVQQAKAAIKVAKALRESAVALAAEAEASVARAAADANRYRSEFERISALAAEGAVTKKLVEEAENQSKAADAARQEVAAKITSAKAVIAEKAAGIEQAEADLRAAEARLAVAVADEARLKALLQYTTLYAPFDGIVSARNIDNGHLVQPGKTASDKPLFVIVQAEKLRIFVDVPEADAALVAAGSEANIRVPSLGGETFTGKITRTAWVLNPSTRTLRAEIDVPNADGKLRPGLYVYADLKVAERADVPVLPRSAVLVQDGKTYCLRIVDGKIVNHEVQVGLRAGDELEIISGLSGDEQVIAGNLTAYRAGQAVEVVPPAGK